MSLYDTLGVDKNADAAAIKKAYRRKAQRHHPDKDGDPEKFYPVQKAYEVLGDEERRKRYDETGQADELPDLGREIREAASALLLSTIENVDSDRVDILLAMKDHLSRLEGNLQSEKRKAQQTLAKRERAVKRLVSKQGGSVLEDALLQSIKEARAKLAQVEHTIEVSKGVQALLDKYGYDLPKAQQPASRPMWGMDFSAAFIP